jgi:hypothetical protein
MSPRCGFGWRGNTIFYQYVAPNGAKVPEGGYIGRKKALARNKVPSGRHLIKKERLNLTGKNSPNYFL